MLYAGTNHAQWNGALCEELHYTINIHRSFVRTTIIRFLIYIPSTRGFFYNYAAIAGDTKLIVNYDVMIKTEPVECQTCSQRASEEEYNKTT